MKWGGDSDTSFCIICPLTRRACCRYPFALPDMVGGNAYHGLPERELYVRWLEASALLPAVQLSIPPWHYDDDVVEIAHKMLQLRRRYSDLIVQLGHDATGSGSPIVRPLWWLAPGDEVALGVDDEFLLGDGVLVAPVLERGATSRRVYLPHGRSPHQPILPVSARYSQTTAFIVFCMS